MGHPRSPNWTLDFEPAFSPRFLPTLSPRSFFPTRQRFPISNHVTSGSMSPRSLFSHWSAVSPSKPRDFRLHEPTIPFTHWSAVSHSTSGDDVTRPIRSHHLPQMGPLYYLFKKFLITGLPFLGVTVSFSANTPFV